MNRTTLVRKVRVLFGEEFLEGSNSIGNKASKRISKSFQINQESPVRDLAFTTLSEDEVDGFLESSIPRDEERPKLSMDAQMLAIKDQDTITLRDDGLCAFKQRRSSVQGTQDSPVCRRAMHLPAFA